MKRLANHEIYAQMYDENDDDFAPGTYQKGEGLSVDALTPWDSRKCAMALFTVNQDVVIDELKDRFDLEDNASWEQVKKVCMPIWIKDTYKLRLVVEWISKVSFRIVTEEILNAVGEGTAQRSKAEVTSLWYILLNKKSALISLYEKEKATGGDKVAGMLA